jgi:hypothetical protein
MLELEVSSVISFWKGKSKGDEPDWKRVELRAMQNVNP